MRQVGATLHCGARASHCRGLSCCGAQAPDVQAQQLWLTGLVTPRHVGSSQTRARTRVPRIGSQILNHCTTREAPEMYLLITLSGITCQAPLSLPRGRIFPRDSSHPHLFRAGDFSSSPDSNLGPAQAPATCRLKGFCLVLFLVLFSET